MGLNNICLQCHKRPKRPKYQFCSPTCTRNAAKAAPKLRLVPNDHVMYKDVFRSFKRGWKSKKKRPKILDIFLITWTAKQRTTFDKYRDGIAKKRKLKSGTEHKYFRTEKRACLIGERGNLDLCQLFDCNMCNAIRTGFQSTFDYKQKAKGRVGIPLGRGVYTSPTSSKQYDLAVNTRKQSPVKAMFHCRVVVGKRHNTRKRQTTLKGPPRGYDSVMGVPGRRSYFKVRELCVYNRKAVLPAYLIMCKPA